jgi:hypothetical protein
MIFLLFSFSAYACAYTLHGRRHAAKNFKKKAVMPPLRGLNLFNRVVDIYYKHGGKDIKTTQSRIAPGDV